jgi:hypothetical protein
LKTLTTDKLCIVVSKFVNLWTIDNVVNFIFVANNCLPINAENEDRRYEILKCSNKDKNNF